VVTHGHSDHASRGHASCLCSRTCGPILRTRLGAELPLETLEFGERRRVGDVVLSLHPAGHVLGSAQVRVEHAGDVWVVSGDYKVQHDATAEAFEPVPCRTFITESTFGLPIFRWPDPALVMGQINEWWRANAEAGVASVISAYSLGKAQRVLAGLDVEIGPVLVHSAVAAMLGAYAEAGVTLPAVETLSVQSARRHKGRAMVIAPPAAENGPWLRALGTVSDASASGWMLVRGNRRRQSVDRGFVLSDHADWPGLLWAIEQTGAERVGVTHGSSAALCRWLNEQGREAFVVPTRFRGEGEEEPASEEPARGALLAHAAADQPAQKDAAG